MYHMMQRRRNFGVVLDAEEDEDDDLHIFMDKYDLQKTYVTFRFSLHIRPIHVLHADCQ